MMKQGAGGDGLDGLAETHFIGKQGAYGEGEMQHPLALIGVERAGGGKTSRNADCGDSLFLPLQQREQHHIPDRRRTGEHHDFESAGTLSKPYAVLRWVSAACISASVKGLRQIRKRAISPSNDSFPGCEMASRS